MAIDTLLTNRIRLEIHINNVEFVIRNIFILTRKLIQEKLPIINNQKRKIKN